MRFSRHRWIGWLLIIAFGALVIRSFTDFRSLVATLLTGGWPWLLAAIGVHLLYFVPYALMYQIASSIVDVQILLLGITSLIHRHAQRFYDELGAVIFMIFIAVLYSALLLARWRPGRLKLLLDGARRLVDRLGSGFIDPRYWPRDGHIGTPPNSATSSC